MPAITNAFTGAGGQAGFKRNVIAAAQLRQPQGLSFHSKPPARKNSILQLGSAAAAPLVTQLGAKSEFPGSTLFRLFLRRRHRPVQLNAHGGRRTVKGWAISEAAAEEGQTAGAVKCHKHLHGLLSYYHCRAA